eukprot:scaffold97245_cov20-Prasinocladus_malaysianus.AAC.1
MACIDIGIRVIPSSVAVFRNSGLKTALIVRLYVCDLKCRPSQLAREEGAARRTSTRRAYSAIEAGDPSARVSAV